MTQLKWKKKKWREILAPQSFGSQPVGESFTLDSQDLIGKTASVNLMHLTKNPRKQNITVTFKVTGVEQNKGVTKTYSYIMLPASIKRFVRAGRDRIDESFVVKTKDAQYARVKPLMISANTQAAAIRTKIRRQVVTHIRQLAAKVDFEEFVKQVVDGKVQKELKPLLDTITRLRTFEIRSIQLIENMPVLKLKKLQKEGAFTQESQEETISQAEE